MTDAPKASIAGQMRGIVGIEIDVKGLLGKWKMSQNRIEADHLGAAGDLATSHKARERATAAIRSELERTRD